jgi:hypothetical protein
MPITIDFTPMGEVAQKAFEAGRGRYRQQQQQVALQLQEMAMRDAAQQRAIQANLLSQGIAGQQRNAAAQQEMMFRAAMGNQQFQQQAALQQQQNDAYTKRAEFQRQEMLKQANLQGQYGMAKGAMDAIYDLEGKGAQYTPDQQRFLSELDAARQKAAIDESLDDAGKQAAEMQYWQKRSRVVPTQPPPKTPQEALDESVATYTFPDGTEVPGIFGERNGVPVFNPIEKPEDPEAKLKQEQQKLAATEAKKKQEADAKALEDRRKQVEEAWEATQKELDKLDLDVPKIDDPKALEAYEAKKEAVRQRLVERYTSRYWKDAVQLAPHIADALGIEELEDLIPPEEMQGPAQAAPGAVAGGGSGFQLPPLQNDFQLPSIPGGPAPAGAPAGAPAPAAPQQPEPEPAQVARQFGVTPALLEQREAALLAKPPEAWTREDKAMFESIQRLKTKLGMDGPPAVVVTPNGFQEPAAPPPPAPRRFSGPWIPTGAGGF